jgi:hypothetical protein
MAQQAGIIKLKGTLGDISFYKTSDGFLARTKGGVDGDRIANDPAFQRTRENGAEFGRAGKGGKLIRNAIRVLLRRASDKRVTSRLTTQLLAIVKTDSTNPRGERTIVDGNMDLLNGFEFNKNGKLGSTLFAPYTIVIDRVTGEVTVDLAAFEPLLRVNAPGGTTHFSISMGGAELDFENETHIFETSQTAILPYDNTQAAAINLTAALTAASTLPIIGVLGVEFYQEVNGQMYPLKNGAFNALAVVGVDNP